jgi:hypothetical protein
MRIDMDFERARASRRPIASDLQGKGQALRKRTMSRKNETRRPTKNSREHQEAMQTC